MNAAARLALLESCVTIALLAFCGIASADTLCVGNPGGTCDASFSGDGTGLQTALASADSAGHPGDDTVRIDAGTYNGPFAYTSNANGHVAIVGAGTAQTTLTINPAPAALASVIALGPAGQSISGLSISVLEDSDPLNTHTQRGLLMTSSTATDIAITSPTSENVDGVVMNGGTLQQSTITFLNGTVNGNVGVAASNAVDIHDTTIVAQGGIVHNGSTGTVSRAKIISAFEGIEETAGTLEVDDSLITVVKTGGLTGRGLAADNRNNTNSNTDMTINARHLTIVGSGSGTIGAFAVAVGNAGDPDNLGLADATINLADSVIFGPAIALEASADNHRLATINTTYSNYDATTNVLLDNPSGTPGFPAINATNQTNLTPGFVNPGLDFHLTATSPLIDIGDPAAGGPPTDLDGNPRVVDGHNACPVSPRRDIGAYEFNPGACTSGGGGAAKLPSPQTAIDKAPKKTTVKHRVKFRFSSDQLGSTFLCSLDRRPFAPCTSPTQYKVKTGKHKFQVEAVNTDGSMDPTPAVKKFRVV